MKNGLRRNLMCIGVALLASGCFVGSRSADEPRGAMTIAPLASSRATPTFLHEAQVLYEGTVDNLPKSVTPAEVKKYQAMLDQLQTLNYQSCVGCHQPTGCGNKAINATNFTDDGWQRNNSSPGMVTSIVNGKGKIMPSYKAKLTLQQMNYLVEYIRRFDGKPCQETMTAAASAPAAPAPPTPSPTPAAAVAAPAPAAAPPAVGTDGLSAGEAELQSELNREIAGRTIEFRPGGDVLTPEGRKLLDEFVALLRNAPPNIPVEIDGHTDNSGREPSNVSLSQRRADAVARYLVGKGIAPARLLTKGYGSAKPIADNATEDGRRKNRRIEFRVIHTNKAGNA
jgi:cytochrome c oxidase cbb3-type subunit III